MKPIVAFWMVVLTLSTAHSQIERKSAAQVFFQPNSALIDSTALANLEHAILQLPSYTKFYEVELKSYTDVDGSTAHNDQLANARATAVKAVLLKRGFNKKQIRTTVIGERQQRISGESEHVKAQNRAVELSFVVMDRKLAQADFQNDIEQNKFAFDENEAQSFEASDGTQLYVPADAFVNGKGKPVEGKVNLCYKYYRQPEDFVFTDIEMRHTIGEESYFFASSGMFELSATQNNEVLKLAPDKSISVRFQQEPTNVQPNLYVYDKSTKTWMMQRPLPSNTNLTNAPNRLSWFGNNGQRIAPSPVTSYRENNSVPGKINLSQFHWKPADAYPTIMSYVSALNKKTLLWDQALPSLMHGAAKQLSFEEGWIHFQLHQLDSVNKATQKSLRAIDQTYEIAQLRTRGSNARFKIESNKNFKSEIWAIKEVYLTADRRPIKELFQNGNSFEDFYLEEDGADVKAVFIRNMDTVSINVKIYSSNRRLDATEKQKILTDYLNRRNGKEEELEEFLTTIDWASHQIDSLKMELNTFRTEPLKTCTAIPTVKTRSGKHISELEAVYLATRNFSGERIGADFQEWLSDISQAPTKVLNKMVMVTARESKQKEILDVSCQEWFTKIPVQPRNTFVWNSWADTSSVQYKSMMKMRETMTTIQCSELAVYNCDQISRIADPVDIYASYVDTAQRALEPLMIRVLLTGLNGVLQYDGYRNLGPKHFVASRSGKHMIIATDEAGNIYFANNPSMNSTNKGSLFSPVQIVLRKLDGETAKAEVRKAVLELEMVETAWLEK